MAQRLRVICVQHVPFEGPAAIADWAAERGATLDIVHVHRGDPLPAVGAFDLLVSLGGPMSVHDAERFEWIASEIALLGEAVASGKAVLGVCLGAQLLAKALGAEVRRAAEREIGWLPCRGLPAVDAPAALRLPQAFTPLHWHGEEFALPPGAVRLAETDACANQAFALGGRVLGVQFHLEAGRESVDALLTHCANELTGGPWQQSPEALHAGARHAHTNRTLLWRLLDGLTGALQNDATARPGTAETPA